MKIVDGRKKKEPSGILKIVEGQLNGRNETHVDRMLFIDRNMGLLTRHKLQLAI